MSSIVIVGGGLAGARAAHYLRAEGYAGGLTIVASENHDPYQKPPLSKEYLLGKEGLESVYANPVEWYLENNVSVLEGVAAVNIDTAGHEIELADGRKIAYAKLLLATGARARILNIAGADLPGVMYLRTLDDADELAKELRAGDKKLVLIGSGWIGTEAAATARKLGNEVTILDHGAVPLQRVLGEQIGLEVKKMHERHGVKFVMNANVEKIIGTETVTGVVADGVTYPADLVLVGIGAIPNTEIAENSGIAVDNGVLVDSALRTSAVDVYAAGDVANIDHAGAGVRLRSEHWAVARATGKAAAFSILGRDVSYDEIPYFYTDQFEFSMELSGYPNLMADAEMVFRGDVESGEYIAFWVKDARVVAGMNVNVWDVNDKVQALIRSGAQVEIAKLLDEAVPLEVAALTA